MKKLQTTNYKLLTSQKGFTLIEALVATAVFALVISSMLGVYVSTLQLDQKVRAERGLAQNARFIMDYLGKEIRNGTIDYASFGGMVTTTNDLYLEDQSNLIEHFSLSGSTCSVSPCNLLLNKNGASTNLNSSAVMVTNLRFIITPIQDPFVLANNTNEQPHVIIVLGLTSTYGTRPTDIETLNIQSTFATRNYPSRQ